MTHLEIGNKSGNDAIQIVWDSESRIALLRYAPNTTLTGKEGAIMVEALTRWVGADPKPFALLADGTNLRGTDPAYRSVTYEFFRQHRDEVSVAVLNMGRVIRVVADLFRIGTGIQLKGFADEATARSWLRTRGINA